MAAAERRTIAGCVFLFFMQIAKPMGVPGLPDDSHSAEKNSTNTGPYTNCDDDVLLRSREPFRLVTDYCCPETEDGPYGVVYWPLTPVNSWASQPCPTAPSRSIMASRRCAFDRRQGPSWRASDFSKCRTQEDAANAASNAESITANPDEIDWAVFQEATDLIIEASEIAKTNRTVANSMFKALSNLVAAPSSVQEAGDVDVRRELLRMMEEHGRAVRLGDDEPAYECSMPNVHLAVRRVTGVMTSDIMEFRANYNGGTEDPGMVSVQLPPEAIQQAVAAANASGGAELRVRFLALRNGHMLAPPGALSATQQVVTAGLSQDPGHASQDPLQPPGDVAVAGLQQPVRITMPMSRNSLGTTHVCAYYNETSKAWMTDGLRTTPKGATVVCESTHLTPFMLLLDPYPRQSLAGMEQPLTILGSVGSALSILGLTFTIITYKFFGRFSQDRWSRVLVQLCLALLLLHVTYLATNLKGVVSPEACVAVAVMLHAALLASFCWMLIEGLLLYQILVTVFRKADSKFTLKRLAFGWGTPLLIVGINAAVDANYYVDTHPDYCVTSGAMLLQHILSTLAPCGLVMAANLAIFARVCVVLLKHRQAPGVRPDSEDRPRVSWAQVRGVIGVAFLLGVMWPMSPLASNTVMLGFASSTLNAFQGVAIFVSRVLTHPEARACWRRRFCTKTPDLHSSASYAVNDKGSGSSSWLWNRWGSPKRNVATLPRDEQSRPWGRETSNVSTSSGVILSKSTSDTDILY